MPDRSFTDAELAALPSPAVQVEAAERGEPMVVEQNGYPTAIYGQVPGGPLWLGAVLKPHGGWVSAVFIAARLFHPASSEPATIDVTVTLTEAELRAVINTTPVVTDREPETPGERAKAKLVAAFTAAVADLDATDPDPPPCDDGHCDCEEVDAALADDGPGEGFRYDDFQPSDPLPEHHFWRMHNGKPMVWKLVVRPGAAGARSAYDQIHPNCDREFVESTGKQWLSYDYHENPDCADDGPGEGMVRVPSFDMPADEAERRKRLLPPERLMEKIGPWDGEGIDSHTLTAARVGAALREADRKEHTDG